MASEETIFAAALERSTPEERSAYLDEACAGNPALRQRIEALLGSHEGAGDFLRAPAVDEYSITQARPVSEGPNCVIGQYRLLQQIGEGGFGIVYMAEQKHPVERLVALKIIKPGMDTAEVIARFESERQALAIMDHPNIARVFDGGETETGRPYFVMELVRGIPITEYCDQQRMTPHERLALFVSVCHAVQHAHQKGIIHRDIKPSNVLVALHEGDAVAKVIDFGVAKAIHQRLTERTLFTRLGQFLGTPHYMSPEQAGMGGLDVDTRTDVYSLGVLLYELLTGTTPLDGHRLREAAIDEVQRMIREVEPLRPSLRIGDSGDMLPSIAANRHTEPKKLGKLLHGDLDWIVMKALDKDRRRRYDSAGGLAMDVERYLDNDPVTAMPPSAVYRLKKFAGKHRGMLATALAFAALLAAGTIVATLLAVRATNAESLAERRSVQIAEERDNVKDALQAAEVAKQHAEAVAGYLASAFRRPDPNQDGRKVTVAEVLDQAVEQLDDDFPDDPRTKVALLNAIGETYHGLGLPSKAREIFQKAWQLGRISLGDRHVVTAEALAGLATAERESGNYDRAIELHQRVLAVRREVLGEDHVQTLETMHSLGAACWSDGRLDEAERLFTQAIEGRRRKLGEDHQETLRAMSNLGSVYFSSGRWPEALEMETKVLEIRRAKLGERHHDTLSSMSNIGVMYRLTGKVAEAVEMHETILRSRREVLGDDNPATLKSLLELAATHASAGRYAEAIPLHREALAAKQRTLGDDHPDTLDSMNHLANTYFQAGDMDRAVELHEKTLAARRSRLGDEHRSTVESMGNLAAVYSYTGRLRDAVELQEEARDISLANLEADHPSTFATICNLADMYTRMDRPGEAIEILEDAIDRQVLKFGSEQPRILAANEALAHAYSVAKDFDRATSLYETTIARQVTVHGEDHPLTLASRHGLAQTCRDTGRIDESIAMFESVLAARRRVLGDEHPATLESLSGLATSYLAAGHLDEALHAFEETFRLRMNTLGPAHPETLECRLQLGHCYFRFQRFDEAIVQFSAAYDGYLVSLGEKDPTTVLALYNYGYNCFHAGRLDEALPLFERMSELTLANWRDLSSNAALLIQNAAHIYGAAGRWDDAGRLVKEALEQMRRHEPVDRSGLASLLASLALNELLRGEFAGAEAPARECLAIRAEIMPGHWLLDNSRAVLGRALAAQAKYAEAEPLLVEGAEGMLARLDSLPAPARMRLAEALQALVRLYEDQGQPQQAATWKDHLKNLTDPGSE